jgi:hypothetical protein
MLKTTVGWTLMFRVGNQAKAKKELQRAEELLGQELRLSKCEQYWKIPELWSCAADTDFEVPSEAEQIAACLLRAIGSRSGGTCSAHTFVRTAHSRASTASSIAATKVKVPKFQALNGHSFRYLNRHPGNCGRGADSAATTFIISQKNLWQSGWLGAVVSASP